MSNKIKYQSKTIKVWGSHHGKLNRHVRRGWEVVSSSQIGISNWHIYTLRRPKGKSAEVVAGGAA